MSGKRCGVCGQSYRKGAMLWTSKEGRLVQVRACPGCHSSAVILAVGSPKRGCIKCGSEVADLCGVHTAEAIRKGMEDREGIPAAIKRLEGTVKARAFAPKTKDQQAWTEGWLEAMDTAIQLLKSGRF